MFERTLGIIKPDAFSSRESIKEMIKKSGLTLILSEQKTLSVEEAREFYKEHVDKPFFAELIVYMTGGPVEVLLIEGEDAINRWRQLMGSTDPQEAEPGTIRKIFGTNKGRNAVHGSDGPFSAVREIEILLPHI